MDIFLREWTFWGLDKAKNAKIPTKVSRIKWARIPCFVSGIGRNNRSGGFADSIKRQPCSRLAPQFIQLKDLRLFCQFSLALGAREAYNGAITKVDCEDALMNILPVVYQILMLFIIAAMGLLLRARGVFTDPVIKGVNSTVLMVTWPAMMLMTTQREFSLEVFEGFMIVLGGSIVVLSLACALAYVLLRGRVEDRLRPVLCMLAAMPNAGYIGLPIVEAVYGDAATVYLAAYIVGFNIVLWTIGVSLFTGFHIGSLKGMLNPGFICAVLGTILFLLSIRLPTPILSAVNQLGALNTPLSMLLLGARMDTLRPRQLLNAKLWIVTAVKLLAMPLLVLLAARALGVSGMPLGILVLCSAMPAASAGQMLAEKYDARVNDAATGISVSTLSCIATIPLMLLLLG